MPKDGSHIGYSLFPSVCSDLCFVEILTRSVSSIIDLIGERKEQYGTRHFL